MPSRDGIIADDCRPGHATVSAMKRLHTSLMCLALAAPIVIGPGQRAAARAGANDAVTTRAVAAATAFLGTLDAAQRSKVSFAFDSPQRTGWSNLPTGIFQRNGLRFGDLTPKQRDAALALVSTTLSASGYRKVNDIMNGDEVLKTAGGGRTGGRQGAQGGGAGARGGRGVPGAIRFGLDEYYLALLGTPSPAAPWMIQFGGHHLAINVTLVGAAQAMTPSLPAAQPAKYTLDGRTIRPLGNENDKAFALVNALNAAQQKKAILDYQVNDLVLGPGADGKVIQPEGIAASELNAAQQTMLLDLVHEWVGILNDEPANAKMAEIRNSLPGTYFAWSGSTKNGGLAYFRIQGPTVVIEYAPQQGDLDHIHTIYRDPTNDYGAKLVRR